MLLQLVTALPFDALLWTATELWPWVPVVRLVRLVHVYRLRSMLDLLDHALVISYTKVKLIKLVLAICGSANLFACLLFAAALRSSSHYASAPWVDDTGLVAARNGSTGFFSTPYLRSTREILRRCARIRER